MGVLDRDAMEINNMIICLDVWAGECSQDHVARYMLPVDEALQLSKHELTQGNLVNLRAEAVWGEADNFDDRMPRPEVIT